MRIFLFSLFLSFSAQAQTLSGESLKLKSALGIGLTSNTFNSKAALEVKSTTKYVLLPRMTTVQKAAISSPDTSGLLFDTNLNSFQFYNGTAWVALANGIDVAQNSLDISTLYSRSLPVGGSTGQTLSKASGADYDTSWVTPYTDPLTTNGDMLLRTGGVTSRLAIGTTGQALAIGTTGPQWSDIYVSQATFYGGAQQNGGTNCTYSQNTSSGDNVYVDLGSAGSCAQAWTSYGGCAAVGPTSHQITCANMPAGDYKFEVSGHFYTSTSANDAYFRFSDGTNDFGFTSMFSSGTGAAVSGQLLGRQTYATGGVTRTFKIQGSDTGMTTTTGIRNDSSGKRLIWRIWRFPTAAQAILPSNAPQFPTIQKFTSGSSVYNKPAGVTHIRVRMVGGGAGGGGSGAAGGAGGNTTFGTGLLVANGGQAGTNNANAGSGGGSASLGTGPVGIALTGGSGQSVGAIFGTLGGGIGAASPFGGAGGGGVGFSTPPQSGYAAIANTGSGGGGAGGTNASTSGHGGSAGGYVDAIIYNPANSYSYSVGVGGTGGGGTFIGGNGGSGVIIVEEYYGVAMPVINGSVTSASAGAERVERVYVAATCSASPCTMASNTPGISSVTRIGTGAYVVNFPVATWASAPACVASPNTGGSALFAMVAGPTTTTVNVNTYTATPAAADGGFSLICMGPR